MRIKRLRLDSWKGVSTDMEVSPLNLLVGPNGSGKSGRMHAIQYAITGTTPFGARPDDAVKLVGPGGGGVEIETDGGFCFSRHVKRDHMTGSVTETPAIRGRSEGKLDAGKSIAVECGLYAPMFDIGAFLDLSPDKRRNAVMELCGTSGAINTVDTSERIMIGYLRHKLGPGTVAEFFAGSKKTRRHGIVNLLDRIGETERMAANAILDAVTAVMTGDTTSALARALEEAKKQISAQKMVHDENTQAARKLSEERETIKVAAESLDVLQERLAALRGERDGLKGDIARFDASESTLRALNDAVASARREHDARLLAKQAAERDAEEIPALQLKAENFEAAAEAVVIPEPPSDAAMLEARNDYQTKHNHFQDIYGILCGAITESKNALARLEIAETNYKAAQSDPWRTALDLTWAAIKASVFNGAHAETDALVKFLESKLGENPLAFKRLFDLAEKAHHEAAMRQSDARAKLEIAGQEKDDAYARNNEAESAYKQAQYQIVTVREQAKDTILRMKRDAQLCRDRIKTIDYTVITAAAEVDNATKTLLDATRRLATAQAETGGINREVAQANLLNCEIQITTLTEAIKTKIGYQAVEAELLTCRRKAEEGMVAHDTAKLMEKAIKELRDELMAELIKPLILHMNRFLANAGRGEGVSAKLENERGKPTLDLEWTIGQTRVPLDALSGGESALFFTALAYALTVLADPPLKVLMVEASELDDGNMKAIVAALKGVEDEIGNVFLATHTLGFPVDNCCWNVVECQKVERKAVQS